MVAWLMTRTPTAAIALLLAAVTGGAVGNVVDRLFRSPGLGRGAVIDWIHVAGYPASFNVADIAIRAGAIGTTAVMLRARGSRQALANQTPRGR